MFRIAVLASGSGTNAENLARAFAESDKGRVSLLLTNKEDAGVHERLKKLGVPSVNFSNDVWANNPEVILAKLAEEKIDFIALCGFLRKIHPDIVKRFENRMLNIHPSLLPKFGGKGMYGMKVHEAVVAAGEKESGATVHYVTDEMDEGAILLQGVTFLKDTDTPADVAAKVHEVEMLIYPEAVERALDKLAEQ